MKRITIERYKNASEMGSAGLIEGETDDGRRWILFLDESGAPKVFWPERDEDGGVVGDGIQLDRARGQFSGVFDFLGVADDADADVRATEVVASFPVFIPDDELVLDESQRFTNDKTKYMRGAVFAVVPGATDPRPGPALKKFLTEMLKGFEEV